MSADQATDGLPRDDIQRIFSLYSSRRLQEALADTGRLLASHGDALLLNIRGAICAGLGQLDDAVASYRRALRLRPGIPDPHFHLGNALVARGDHGEAVSEYAQAVRLRPGFVEAHSNLCRELERANRLDELQQALATAGANCPSEHPLLQLRRAEWCKRMGDFSTARRILETSPYCRRPGNPGEQGVPAGGYLRPSGRHPRGLPVCHRG